MATSQPAVSRALNLLERRLGTHLFERHPRGVTPTDAGRLLIAHGQAVQAVTARAERQLVVQIASRATELAIGIAPQISIVPTARALAALHQLDPAPRVVTKVGPVDQLIEALRTGDLDLVVGSIPADDRGLVAVPLFDDRPVIAVRVGHPLLNAGKGRDIDAFADFPWVMPPSGDDMSRRLQDLFDDVELDAPRPTIVTRDVPLATAIPNASDFITVLPRDVAMLAVSMGRLAVLPVELPGPPNVVGALRRRDVPPSPESAQFVESLRSELAGIGIMTARSS
jgi:DNA-binding transcriptional LysR family regulator